MRKQVLIYRAAEQLGGRGWLPKSTPWHRLLLACMAAALMAGGPGVGEAGNGEPVGAEGLHRTGACSSDFTISCDDRAQAGSVSCHMRGTKGDEGLAVNACVDGRVTVGVARSQFLEKEVAINASDFGEFVCGKEPGATEGSLVDFCIVCDTFRDPEASGGASHCVKVVHDNPAVPTLDDTCGAFSVSTDATGAACLSQTQDLQQFFSNPRLGFSIDFDASDASVPGAKDLLVCSGRSWQCIDNRPAELAIDAQQVQRQQTHELINTGCCIKLASGASYCSTKFVTSSTCR